MYMYLSSNKEKIAFLKVEVSRKMTKYDDYFGKAHTYILFNMHACIALYEQNTLESIQIPHI